MMMLKESSAGQEPAQVEKNAQAMNPLKMPNAHVSETLG